MTNQASGASEPKAEEFNEILRPISVNALEDEREEEEEFSVTDALQKAVVDTLQVGGNVGTGRDRAGTAKSVDITIDSLDIPIIWTQPTETFAAPVEPLTGSSPVVSETIFDFDPVSGLPVLTRKADTTPVVALADGPGDEIPVSTNDGERPATTSDEEPEGEKKEPEEEGRELLGAPEEEPRERMPEPDPLKRITDEKWKELQIHVGERVDQADAKILGLESRINTSLPKMGEQQAAFLKTADSLGQTNNSLEAKPGDAALTKQQTELKTKDLAGLKVEEVQLKAMEKLRQQVEALKIERALLLIASGEDKNIKEGELALAELVLKNPALQANGNFHDSVMRAYVEMATLRNGRGMEPWKSTLKVDDIIKEKAPADPGNPEELLQAASKIYFEKGIDAALPEFEKAIKAAGDRQKLADRSRLELFLKGLNQDALIGITNAKGEDTKALIDQRLDLVDEEVKASRESTKYVSMGTNFGINTAFAKIASGDAKHLAAGTKELKTILAANPSITLNEDFRATVASQFKGYHANKPADVPKEPGDQKPAEPKPGWKELDPNKKHVPEIDNEPEKEEYLSDYLTNIAIMGLLIGSTGYSIYRTINNKRINRQ